MIVALLFLGGFLLVSIGAHILRFGYFLNLWYSADCFMSAVLAGDPRETMSSRLGKAARRGNRFARTVCRGLSMIDAYHCDDAIAEHLGEQRVPLAMMIVGLAWLLVAVLAVF